MNITFINVRKIFNHMGKKDLIKSGISVLVIIVLAVLIVNANNLISPRAVQEQDMPASGGSVTDYGECFSENPSTVVFVHSNGCPHCRNMVPIIEELENEGYGFYWAESSDSESREMVNSCFAELLGGYVPQFICPATGKEQTGGMSKEELKKFADSCI